MKMRNKRKVLHKKYKQYTDYKEALKLYHTELTGLVEKARQWLKDNPVNYSAWESLEDV